MVPMMGNKIALNDAVFANDEHVAIAYGMGITAENVAKQWKVTPRGPGCLRGREPPEGREGHRGGRISATKFCRTKLIRPRRTSPRGSVLHRKKIADTDEGPRPDSSAESLGEAEDRLRGQR